MSIEAQFEVFDDIIDRFANSDDVDGDEAGEAVGKLLEVVMSDESEFAAAMGILQLRYIVYHMGLVFNHRNIKNWTEFYDRVKHVIFEDSVYNDDDLYLFTRHVVGPSTKVKENMAKMLQGWSRHYPGEKLCTSLTEYPTEDEGAKAPM